MQIISFCFHLIFLAFFFWLGTSWLMIVPLFGIFFQFIRQWWVHLPEGDLQDYLKETVLKHGIIIAWVLIMFGIIGIFDLYQIPRYEIALDLLLVNIAGWFATSRRDSRDGMRTFHIGMYVALLMIIATMPWISFMLHFLIIGAFLSLLTWCYAFMIFLIQPLDKNILWQWWFLLFIYSLISLIYLIYWYTYNDMFLMIVLWQVLLLIIYSAIYLIQRYSYRVWRFHDHEEDAFLRVLSGRKLNEFDSVEQIDTLLWLDYFLEHLSLKQKSFIGWFNIILMILQVSIFLQNIWSGLMRFRQLVFRFGIAVFFVNYMLLRNTWFPHRFQRVIAFVMLNFGVYVTLVNIFGNNMEQIVSFGIIWSLISSTMMLSSEWIQKSLELSKDDYMTWIIANIFASLCNLYFIIMLPFTPQLRFSIAFFYLWLQLFLILYGTKKVLRV